jgi:hypothetical protein
MTDEELFAAIKAAGHNLFVTEGGDYHQVLWFGHYKKSRQPCAAIYSTHLGDRGYRLVDLDRPKLEQLHRQIRKPTPTPTSPATAIATVTTR